MNEFGPEYPLRRKPYSHRGSAVEAPHDCGNPECPGVVNKKRIELFPALLEACKLVDFIPAGWPMPLGWGKIYNQMKITIAEAEEVKK